MSGGFFRGTSADQDTRFSNKQAKLLKSQKFAPELETAVNMKKVNLDVMRPWIATRVTELLGFEDEVLINFIYGLLEVDEVDGKKIQIQLTGFMEKNTVKFMKELWGLLLSAQNNVSGVPQQFLDSKEEEMRKKKAETDRITQEIQRRREKERSEVERGKHDRMGIEVDASRNGTRTPPCDPDAKKSQPQYDDENMDDQRKRNARSKDRDGVKSRSPSISSEFERLSTSPQKGSHTSPKQVLVSPERRQKSPSRSKLVPRHKRSLSPLHRHPSPTLKRSSPTSRSRRRFSPIRQRSPHYRWRSPSPKRRRSPSPFRRRSRSPIRRQSPYVRRSSPSPYRRFPSPLHGRSSPALRRSPLRRNRSPIHRRNRSPSPVHQRNRSPSPIHRRNRSPSPVHRRNKSPSPVRRRNRSPSPVRRRNISPSPIHQRNRSPSPIHLRNRSSPPLHLRNRSPSPIHRRNRSPSPIHRQNRSPSPIHRHNRSPSPIHHRLQVRRRSPTSLRYESPRKQRSQSPPRYNSSTPSSRSPAHRPPEYRTPSASPRHATEITLEEKTRYQTLQKSLSPSLRSNRSSSREIDNHNNNFQSRRHRDDIMSERTHVKKSPDHHSTKIAESRRLQSSLGSPQPHSMSQRDILSRMTRERSSNDFVHDNKQKKRSLSRSPGARKINRISHSNSPKTDEEATIYARETVHHRTDNLLKKRNQFPVDGIGKKLVDKKRSPEMYSSVRSPEATLSPGCKDNLQKHKSERKRHELSSDVLLLGKDDQLSPSDEREYGPGTIWEESPSMHKSNERHGSKKNIVNSPFSLDEKPSSEHVAMTSTRDACSLSGDDGQRERIFVESAKDSKEKADKKYQWKDIEMGCKEDDADRFYRKKRKHKRHKKRDSDDDDDDEYDSEMDDRREAKRRRKDEKRQHREERHRRREERHLRRLERRSGRPETESVDTVTPYLEKHHNNADGSGGGNKMMYMGTYLSDSEETESEQKKLEVELRKKALESLRAKKAINP